MASSSKNVNFSKYEFIGLAREKLATEDFVRKFEKFRKENNIKISASNPALISFLSDYLGLPESIVKTYSKELILLIGDILTGRVKIRREDPGNYQGEPHIHVNNLANTVYMLYYKLSPATASRRMYELLEPYVVKALSGDEDAQSVLNLYFTPISSYNYREIVDELVKLVKTRFPELCKLSRSDFSLLCLKSSYLPISKKNNGSPADECTKYLMKCISEVCH